MKEKKFQLPREKWFTDALQLAYKKGITVGKQKESERADSAESRLKVLETELAELQTRERQDATALTEANKAKLFATKAAVGDSQPLDGFEQRPTTLTLSLVSESDQEAAVFGRMSLLYFTCASLKL